MGWLEDALLLLVHGGPVRNGFSSVEGDHVSLESVSLGCESRGKMKKIPLVTHYQLLNLPARAVFVSSAARARARAKR
jgi:hypothetical protein